MAQSIRRAGQVGVTVIVFMLACGSRSQRESTRANRGQGTAGLSGGVMGGAMAAGGLSSGAEPAAAGAGGGSAGSGPHSGAGGYGGSSGPPDVGGEGGAGGAEDPPRDPYAPRTGSFKMLVYSGAKGYRHSTIEVGSAMLQKVAAQQGFEVVLTDTNELITPAGLAEFEVVYFNNTSGDVFSDAEQAAFEAWITSQQGGYAGHHSATNTEGTWSFYAELTGQYFNGWGPGITDDNIVFEEGAESHPAIAGLPNPWPRHEEWFHFDLHEQWSTKPGFRILGRRAADGQPIVWVREWRNVRAFYTGLGHESVMYEDASFVRHVTGGIMWAARREHLIK